MYKINYLTACQSDALFRLRSFFILMIMGASAFSSQGHAQATIGFPEDTKTQDPTVMAPAGGVNQAGDVQLQWTLGEAFTGAASSDHVLYTAGFHQPSIKIKIDYIADTQTASDVRVFPNPFTDYLNVQIKEGQTGKVTLVITNAQGRAVVENSFLTPHDMPEMYIPEIPAGHYTLHLKDSEDKPMHSFIIIKSN